MNRQIKLQSPFTDSDISELQAGTSALVSGVIYTARDAAHKRLAATLENGEPLPFDINGQTIYYLGPSPAPPGKIIGAAGPTTSSRMDPYTPTLLAAGLKAIIGKGYRNQAVRQALQEYRAVYFATFGGAGALLATAIKEVEVIAYPDLGPEAIRRLKVENLPVIVANDSYGNDLFEQEQAKYRSV